MTTDSGELTTTCQPAGAPAPGSTTAPTRPVVAVTSAGGVLLDTQAVVAALAPTRWVAVPAVDTESRLAGEDVTWIDEVALARPGSWIRGFAQAWRDLRARPAEMVVSAGTGLAVPWFLAARARGIRTLWVETWNLVGEDQGTAAEVCSRLADSVVVQRPERLLVHRRSLLVGELY